MRCFASASLRLLPSQINAVPSAARFSIADVIALHTARQPGLYALPYLPPGPSRFTRFGYLSTRSRFGFTRRHVFSTTAALGDVV